MLNDKQRWVILIGAIVVCGLTLYPPWEWLGQLGTSAGGYGFIFLTPAADGPGDRVDMGRLIVQLAVTGFVTLGLVLALGRQDESD